ncbi:cytidine deaminase [bacterium K02(2017)]|nr:cytidine deaminase [bacterium K02(2017)]
MIDQETQHKLLAAANNVRKNAYAPYSNYHVGSAVLTENGEIVVGCNVENACYNLGACSERNTLSHAIALGHNKFKALALVTEDGGFPCGGCRQFIWQLCGDIPLIVSDKNGKVETCQSSTLLPRAFELDPNNR